MTIKQVYIKNINFYGNQIKFKQIWTGFGSELIRFSSASDQVKSDFYFLNAIKKDLNIQWVKEA